MPVVDIRVIENTFSHEEKREAVERISETLFDVWGDGIRGATHVLITETPEGEWAVGGRALTADDVNTQMRGR